MNSSIITDDPNVITADEISELPHSHLWKERYKYFVCIDILRGRIFASGECKKLFCKYVVGKEIHLFTTFSIPTFTSTVVYIKNYMAIIRCAYPTEYAWCFKGAGYTKEQITSIFPQFDDHAENSFYVCIRPTNYNFVDLNGTPALPDGVYEGLFACRKQILTEMQK